MRPQPVLANQPQPTVLAVQRHRRVGKRDPEQDHRPSTNAILAAVIAASRAGGLHPMTMCILDPSGHVVAAQREDHRGILRFEIAFGKAWGSLGMGHATRYLQETLAKSRPRFVDALAVAADGRCIPVLGGALIRDVDGTIVGALGVTGDSAEHDEIVALEAIAACGLTGKPN